jgi:hypothetical protein
MPPDQEQEQLPVEMRRNRRGQLEVEDFELNPMSLVGSWFHRTDGGDPVEQGMVVAEVQPGTYLLDVEPAIGIKRKGNVAQVQRLVKIDQLLGDGEYRFYDTEEQMRSGFSALLAESEVPHGS